MVKDKVSGAKAAEDLARHGIAIHTPAQQREISKINGSGTFAQGSFGVVHKAQPIPKAVRNAQKKATAENGYVKMGGEGFLSAHSTELHSSAATTSMSPPLSCSDESNPMDVHGGAVVGPIAQAKADQTEITPFQAPGAHYEAPLGADTEKTQPLLAVKCLDLQYWTNQEEMAFWHKITHAAGKQHPNVLNMLSQFTNADQTAGYVISPWMPKTLTKLISEGTHVAGTWLQKLSVERASQIAVDGLTGLEHMHSEKVGLMHRDIKPDNILIRDNGTAIIADFGLCIRMRSLQDPKKTIGWCSEKAVGTIMYASPQQVGVRLVRKDDENNPIMLYEIDGVIPVMRQPHGYSEMAHAEQEITSERELRAQLQRLGEDPPGERFQYEENKIGTKYTATADVYSLGASIVEAIRGESMYNWNRDNPEKTRMDIKLNRLRNDGVATEIIEGGKIIREAPRETIQGRATLFNMTRYISARCTSNQARELAEYGGLRRDCDMDLEGRDLLPKLHDEERQSIVVPEHPARAEAAIPDSAMKTAVIFAMREQEEKTGVDIDQTDETVEELTALYASKMFVADSDIGYPNLPDGSRDARHPVEVLKNGDAAGRTMLDVKNEAKRGRTSMAIWTSPLLALSAPAATERKPMIRNWFAGFGL